MINQKRNTNKRKIYYQNKYKKVGNPPSKEARGIISKYFFKFHSPPFPQLKPDDIERRWCELIETYKSLNLVEGKWTWDWANNHNHDVFLGTEYWLIISSKKKHDIGCCEHCGSTKRLEVHHPNYKIKGNEHNNMDALVVLCRNCHTNEHGIVKRIYNSIKKPKQSNPLHGTILHAILLLNEQFQ